MATSTTTATAPGRDIATVSATVAVPVTATVSSTVTATYRAYCHGCYYSCE